MVITNLSSAVGMCVHWEIELELLTSKPLQWDLGNFNCTSPGELQGCHWERCLFFPGPKGHQKHLAGFLADTHSAISHDTGWKPGLDAVSMKSCGPYSLGRKNTVARKS